jgi:acyl-coenzyme A synthetase/AMP-(fatty) acid ligase
VLHFWGFTVQTAEVERALFSLPYIADAVVLPLEDEDHQERTAAILKLKPSCMSSNPSLETLRGDLTEKTALMLFKLPTVVYWLRETEEISVTVNGKVSKLYSRKKFFGDEWWHNERVEVFDLSGMGYWRMGGQC